MVVVLIALYIIIGFLAGGVIGALISKAVGYDRQNGFLWGAFLGLIGWTVIVLSNRTSEVTPGRQRVQCPYCEAPQHLTGSDLGYTCWQCHQSTIVEALDFVDSEGRFTVQCPKCSKKSRITPGVRYTCSCGSRNNIDLLV